MGRSQSNPEEQKISFWVSKLTDGVRLDLKNADEADVASETAEEASSVDGNAAIKDSVIKVLAK
jgi:hypothetical protein